ncbi:MAG: hypothetical protein A3G76_02805 [Acidobacteria bacterium RIFCSPLOWO2_12_FULL_65_11]|nr:MAG: hypothetical protein A3G76_02805 [Acidobacteria bacterium RIFCSPLOWO2_12_FULL_65_11]
MKEAAMFRPAAPLTKLVLIVALVPATATAQTIPFEESARRAVQQLAQAESQASVPPGVGQVPPAAIPIGADGRCTEKRASRGRGKPIPFADLSSSIVSAPASLFGKPTARLNVGDAVSVIDTDD